MRRRDFLRLGALGTTGAALVGGAALAGCDSFLEPEVNSELASEFAQSEQGIESILLSAYAAQQYNWHFGNQAVILEEWTTDIEWETGGGANRIAVPMINFTWDPSTLWFDYRLWGKSYEAIRDANTVLESLDAVDIGEEAQTLTRAEAQFIRAVSYARLYLWFGPVPLRTSSEQELELPRASESELLSFVEEELLAAVPNLPAPGTQSAYGRATSGAARGHLVKFYLNTKQWQKTADMAQEVIDMGDYSLQPDYVDMFKAENDGNSEMVWVHPATVEDQGSAYMNGAFPPRFSEFPLINVVHTDRMNNWAANYRVHGVFYESFEEGDRRRDMLMSEYIDTDGNLITGLVENDDVRSMKRIPDPEAIGNWHGTDIPDIRYADILLSRAEALNELSGPNQESVGLMNQVRARAGLEGLSLGDFSSTEHFRNYLVVRERGWEFYTERKRRQDLVRIGMFIEGTFDGYAVGGQDRGYENAQDYHRRFPIPQPAMDANPSLEQNPGY